MRVSTLFLYIFEKRFDVKKSRGIAFIAVFRIGSGFIWIFRSGSGPRKGKKTQKKKKVKNFHVLKSSMISLWGWKLPL
jgi:hypothetical protein